MWKRVPAGGAAQRPKMVPHCSRGSREAGVARGRKQSRTRGCGFTLRTEALEGPERRVLSRGLPGPNPGSKGPHWAPLGKGPGE